MGTLTKKNTIVSGVCNICDSVEIGYDQRMLKEELAPSVAQCLSVCL